MSTKIEWVINPDGTKGETWNPITGCSPVSEGCRNCYAARRAATRLKHHPRYEGLARLQNGRAIWNGEVRMHPDKLEKPLHWRKPRMVFPCSMSDLFHEDVPFSFIAKMFAVMSSADHHTYQILTKRADRMAAFFDWAVGGDDTPLFRWPRSHIWLGVSCENQKAADERTPILLRTPAAVRFVSCEPLLSKIDLTPFLKCEWYAGPMIEPRTGTIGGKAMPAARLRSGLDWVIVGGESGAGARPMHPDWARSLRDQFQAAGVPFFFKQWGAWLHESRFTTDKQRDRGLSSVRCEAGDGFQYVRVGKGVAGRLLDGREWNEWPGK